MLYNIAHVLNIPNPQKNTQHDAGRFTWYNNNWYMMIAELGPLSRHLTKFGVTGTSWLQ